MRSYWTVEVVGYEECESKDAAFVDAVMNEQHTVPYF